MFKQIVISICILTGFLHAYEAKTLEYIINTMNSNSKQKFADETKAIAATRSFLSRSPNVDIRIRSPVQNVGTGKYTYEVVPLGHLLEGILSSRSKKISNIRYILWFENGLPIRADLSH